MPKKTQKNSKKIFKKWQAWVSFLVTIFTLIGLLFEVPQKIASLFKTECNNKNLSKEILSIKSENTGNINKYESDTLRSTQNHDDNATHIVEEKSISSQILSGNISDQKGDFLSDVIVMIPNLGLIDTTDITGKFKFEVKDSKDQAVSLFAKKKGFNNCNFSYVRLGNTSFNFTMTKEK